MFFNSTKNVFKELWSERLQNWQANGVEVIPPTYYKFLRIQIKEDQSGNVCQNFNLWWIMLEEFNFSDSSFTYVIHFSGQPCFLPTSQLSFAPEQLSTLSTFNVLVYNNDHLSVLFRHWVSSVKDENFQSASVFYQVVL